MKINYLPNVFLLASMSLIFGFVWINNISIQADLKKMKESLIEDTLLNHRAFLEEVEIAKGKTSDEAKAYVASLEPYFQREKEKFYRYCDEKNQTPYCKIVNKFNEDLSITYFYDSESFKFFNHPPHIALLKRSSELCSLKTIRRGDNSENVFPVYKKGTRYTAVIGYEEGYDGDGFHEADCNTPVPKDKWIEVDPYPSIEIPSRQFKQIKD